tara:strand:- start:175 stop:510 length:336 start_codon:yes stop_codon:yes gene_type:complete
MAEKYILFKGKIQSKEPMKATESKLKELKKIGYKQGKNYDIVSKKILETAKKGIKISPLGLIADLGSRIGMKSKAVKDLISPEPLTYKRGGAVKRHKGGLMKKPKRAKRGY